MTTTERKIVQIAVAASPEADSLYALCNDGTLWAMPIASFVNAHNLGWYQISQVPQPEQARDND